MKPYFFHLLFVSSSLFALPKGVQTISGEVAVSLIPQSMTVHASDGAIIEWSDFSIGVSENAQFIQPSPDALVLNRVIEAIPSQILGKLEANGKVILLNPAGIFFGKESRIDTGTLIASTLDIQDQNFHDRKFIFNESVKGVISGDGQIFVQDDLFLIADRIDWSGKIDAQGEVGLLAGTEIFLSHQGLDSISIRHGKCPNRDNYFDQPSISLTGSIHGKQIALLGPSITLLSGASLDASLPERGGIIWLGGPFKGLHPHVSNAEVLFMHEGATISSNALLDGNGGQIVLWSDHCTIVEGPIFAKGGPNGGNGGFVEISSHGALFPNGMVYTDAPFGNGGEILIDPVDVTLSAAGVNSGFMNPPPYNPLTFTAGNANILYATLQVWLNGGNSVTIQTNQNFGGTGNITSLTGNPTTWNNAANLVFDVRGTTGNVFLQHSFACHGTGSVSILADGPPACHGASIGTITIQGNTQTAAQRHTYFGSRQGSTIVNAPGYDVRLVVPNLAAQLPMAMIGYPAGFPAAGGFTGAAVSGPITVICSDLIMIDQNPIPIAPASTATQVGHGWASNIGAVTDSVTVTTSAATINITAYGNIEMTTGPTGSFAHIGHGGAIPFTGSTLDGNINVTVGGDLLINVPNNSVSGGALIGHGGVATQAPGISLDGNINVAVGGEISMTATVGGTSNLAQIGHRGTTGAVNIGQIRPAPISVTCGGDLTMMSAAGVNLARLGITHGAVNLAALNLNGSISLSIGGNLFMESNATDTMSFHLIGRAQPATITGFSPIEIGVGGNLVMDAPNTTGDLGFQIGYSPSGAGNNTSTAVMVGGDILLSSFKPSDGVANFGLGITSFGDVNVSAGGDIILTAGNRVAPQGRLFIGTNGTDAATLRTTRIFAGGSILAQNGTNNQAFFGEASLPPVAPTFSIDVRAADDIQMASSIITSLGSLFVSADANLVAGDLWTNGGGNLTSCCGSLLANPLPYNAGVFAPLPCPSTAPNASLLADSPDIPVDGLGAFRVLTAPFSATNQITFQTTSGNITLQSAPLSVGGATQDLNIGDNLSLLTTSGNIEIFGSVNDATSCVRADSFTNITIEQPITTTGTVLISAQNDIAFTATGSITTPNSVTLIVDNQQPIPFFSGTGNLTMAPGSFINGNPIRIYTSQQGFNSIQGLINGAPFVPGTLFANTATEIWCTYWCVDIGTSPFTIFYKNCLGPTVNQATIIVSQFNIDLDDPNWFYHGLDEYYGWPCRFIMFNRTTPILTDVNPYYIRRARDLIFAPLYEQVWPNYH